MNTTSILYENGAFFIVKAKHGFEIYQSGITHATRKAIIGYGLDYAIARCDALAAAA